MEMVTVVTEKLMVLQVCRMINVSYSSFVVSK